MAKTSFALPNQAYLDWLKDKDRRLRRLLYGICQRDSFLGKGVGVGNAVLDGDRDTTEVEQNPI